LLKFFSRCLFSLAQTFFSDPPKIYNLRAVLAAPDNVIEISFVLLYYSKIMFLGLAPSNSGEEALLNLRYPFGTKKQADKAGRLAR